MNGLPTILSRHDAGDGLDLTLAVAADNPWFEGHFDGRPILPGVVQIGWAAWFAARWQGLCAPPRQLERIKFKRPVGPDTRLHLQLRRKPGKIAFEYRLDSPDAAPVIVSSGTFVVPTENA